MLQGKYPRNACHVIRLSAEDLDTMSKNKLIGINFGIRPTDGGLTLLPHILS